MLKLVVWTTVVRTFCRWANHFFNLRPREDGLTNVETEKHAHDVVQTNMSDFVCQTKVGPTLTCAVGVWHFIGWSQPTLSSARFETCGFAEKIRSFSFIYKPFRVLQAWNLCGPLGSSSQAPIPAGVCNLFAPAITILFLSDVGIFIVHAWCATQTRPRFNVPSERRGVTSFSNTQNHRCTMPGPGIEPGPFPWETVMLTTRPLRPVNSKRGRQPKTWLTNSWQRGEWETRTLRR